MNIPETPQATIEWASSQLTGPRDDWYATKELILMNRLCDALIENSGDIAHPNQDTFALALGDIESTAGKISIGSLSGMEIAPGTLVATCDKNRYHKLVPRITAQFPFAEEPSPLRFSLLRTPNAKYIGNVSLYACNIDQIGKVPRKTLVDKRTLPIAQLTRNAYLTSSVLEIPSTFLLVGEEAMHEYISATNTSLVSGPIDQAHRTLSRTITGLRAGFAKTA